MSEERPIVIDNGSYKLKFGFAGQPQPYVAMNSLAKDKYGVTHLSNQVNNIKDISSITFRRPHELGQLTSWELESCIWDYCLYNPEEFTGIDLQNLQTKHLVVSETCMTLPELSKNSDQVFFEEYEVDSLYKAPVASFMPFQKDPKDVEIISGKDDSTYLSNITDDNQEYNDFSLVIDSGFNCTWVIPLIKGVPFYKAVKKLDIGGRFLNGLLKETISFRHYNVMDETILVNNIKEKCLFVDPVSYFKAFNRKEEDTIDYVLPDFQTSFQGYVRDPKIPLPENSQVLTLKDERFSVPEVFFHPEITQLLKPGLIETILESIHMLPEVLKPIMASNIVCTGGNFNLPGFANRLVSELQRQLPTDWICRAKIPISSDKSLYGWKAMSEFSQTESYKNVRVTKEEYFEYGLDWSTRERFGYQNWI
ncbi:Actin-like protein ARP6 [Nakaseomyces bracarensis]|uniref:Actin-like protein ARP6 n=1 Tax=Nakaseomyces bracarensis TaxID=273131 RepID=A0ABR4NX59_9SACH